MRKLITGQKSKLRNVSKRLIIDTYENHVEGFINIIAAGTGVGKTYNIANELIRLSGYEPE